MNILHDKWPGCRAAEQHHELPPSHAAHGLPSQWVCRMISLPPARWQVPVAGLNRSEFRGLSRL
jgi:hypothetical protein